MSEERFDRLENRLDKLEDMIVQLINYISYHYPTRKI